MNKSLLIGLFLLQALASSSTFTDSQGNQVTVETTVEYLEVVDDDDTQTEEVATPSCDVNIVAAQYGIYDALSVLQQKYQEFGQKTFNASNAEIGTDGWPGYNKTLVVVYEMCNSYTTVVAKQHELITLP